MFRQTTAFEILLENPSIQKRLLSTIYGSLFSNVEMVPKVKHYWETDLEIHISQSDWQFINSRGLNISFNVAIQEHRIKPWDL